jgi:hypothetical protein
MQHWETGSSRESLFLKAEILPTLITLDCLPIFFGPSSISMTVDIYRHWVPVEGQAGLEAALTGGSSEDFLQMPVRKLRTIACKSERVSVTH